MPKLKEVIKDTELVHENNLSVSIEYFVFDPRMGKPRYPYKGDNLMEALKCFNDKEHTQTSLGIEAKIRDERADKPLTIVLDGYKRRTR